MKNQLKSNLAALTLGLAFVGMNASAAYKRLGPDATISFDEHRAVLTQDSKKKLDSLIAAAKSAGKIDEVQVAAWSDNPAPMEDKNLSETDRKLAEKRKEAVASYLKKGLGVGDVDGYNMAERANWLARVFNTDEAKLKEEINEKDEPMSQDAFKIFRDNGEQKKAVVVVMLKNK